MKRLIAILVAGGLLAALLFFLAWYPGSWDVNPFLIIVILVLSLPIGIPLTIRGVRLLKKSVGDQRYFPAAGFAIAAVPWVIAGLLAGRSTVDIHLHDTYYVFASIYPTFAVALFFLMIAGCYYFFADAFADGRHKRWTMIHCIITFLGCYILFWPEEFKFYHFYYGMPRRYLSYSNFIASTFFLNRWTVIISIATQLVFAGIIVYAARKRFFARG